MKRSLLFALLLVASCGDAERRAAVPLDSPAERPVQWPDLSAAEWDTYSRTIGKALVEPLAPSDLATIQDLFTDYTRRSGEAITSEGIDAFLAVMRLTYDYNRALAANLLLAIDTRQPSLSRELRTLRAAMARTGIVRVSKLAADSALIVSTAYGRESVDEFGVRHQATTRETVLEGMRQLEIMNTNMTRLAQALATVAEP